MSELKEVEITPRRIEPGQSFKIPSGFKCLMIIANGTYEIINPFNGLTTGAIEGTFNINALQSGVLQFSAIEIKAINNFVTIVFW